MQQVGNPSNVHNDAEMPRLIALGGGYFFIMTIIKRISIRIIIA